jgi:alkanesulfonate monooxygenase SsuD/methylene tetrahydromethanopterin reductase-like flavin-dependent oxidoreductase (luciferase family)
VERPRHRDRQVHPQPGPDLLSPDEELTGLPGGLEFTGTPEQSAGLIETWLAEGASDGFTLRPAILPGAIELFADHVVPILQRRGLPRRSCPRATR